MLFLPNLPRETTRESLSELIESQIQAHRLLRLLHHPRLAEVKILSVKEPEGGPVRYHGLIRVTPHHAGPGVLEVLNGLAFRGRPLTARPYAERSPGDRRVAYTDPRLLGFPDRRAAERRGERLEIRVVDSTGSAK